MKLHFLSFVILISVKLSYSQDRTVGLLSYNEAQAFDGYNLLFPHGQSAVFLIDNCGELVHKWEGINGYTPGNSAYLKEDGTLIRCIRNFNWNADYIWAGGGGAIVEALDWEGNLLWSFEQNDSLARLHHDIEVMPNGNVLMISWENKSYEECIQAGRSPDLLDMERVWPDYILEYNPELDSIVWEWHAWDHLVQDKFQDKDNFGAISSSPGRIDINFDTNTGNADWLHVNSIDYNPDLDQIILSVPNFHEIWIIDHSTTTEEAKTSSGGTYGMGGDLLYRWGNPQTYKVASESQQKLFYQHDAQWINDFIEQTDTLYDKLLLFNNRFAENFSVVNVIEPKLSEDHLKYEVSGLTYLPQDYSETIKHPTEESLFSTGLSSVQYLPNGNFLILSGRFGYVFEINQEREIVWEYKVPIVNGEPVQQGEILNINQNLNFRVKRYPADFPAFAGKDLSPKGVLQLEEGEDLCARIVGTEDESTPIFFEVYPNPAFDYVIVNFEDLKSLKIEIFGMDGRKYFDEVLTPGLNRIPIQDLNAGLYVISAGNNRHMLIVDK